MSDATVWAFAIVLALMTLSGASSVIRKKKTPEDYLVASRDVRPWLAALSAVSTNNSGFMFIGMIAYSYRQGVETVWMMVGWVVGDLLGWILVYPRVRRASEEMRVSTLSALIGTRDAGAVDRVVIVAAGLVTLLFLGVYAAGQLKAGSTALHALFGWDLWIGVLIGAVIVIIYSFAGGIRADIWTDAAQSAVMILSMAMILVAGVLQIGGPDALATNLRAQDPDLLTLFPEDPAFGVLPFIIGFTFAGFGAIGQPHLAVRLMSIESRTAIKRAGAYYFLWYIPFFVASIGVGLYSRAVIPGLPGMPLAQDLREPTELALPVVTMHLLPDVFVGVALAGLFAATISTADSQIVVCSGALTQDIRPRWEDSYLASKLGTFSVTTFAVLIALYAPEGVFGLVLIAWSAMGASLAPLLVLRLFDRPFSAGTAIAMMAGGMAAVVAWHVSPYDDDVFKILPGFIVAAAIYAAARLLRRA